MKLAALNAAWRGYVGAVTVWLKLTSYSRRLQLIVQSANGTAEEPYFAKEAELKKHS